MLRTMVLVDIVQIVVFKMHKESKFILTQNSFINVYEQLHGREVGHQCSTSCAIRNDFGIFQIVLVIFKLTQNCVIHTICLCAIL